MSSVPSILFAFVCIPFCLLNTKHFCDLLASLFIGSFTDSFADIAVCHLYSLLEEMVATMKENDCSIAEMRSLSGSCGGNRGSFDSSLQSFLFLRHAVAKVGALVGPRGPHHGRFGWLRLLRSLQLLRQTHVSEERRGGRQRHGIVWLVQ